MKKLFYNDGFSIIEIVITILIISVLTTVAIRNSNQWISKAKYEQTQKEMQQLVYAISGDPSIYNSGVRSNFGYIGDIGSIPPNLDALVTNPGGYATWNGPYIDPGLTGTDYRTDGWGQNYQLIDSVIRSTGSGSNIDMKLSHSVASLISNSVIGTVSDANQSVPGNIFKDSLQLQLIYPDGSGNIAISTIYPDQVGRFQFNSIPIGNHTLLSIYLPLNDTTEITISLTPGKTVRQSIMYPIDLW